MLSEALQIRFVWLIRETESRDHMNLWYTLPPVRKEGRKQGRKDLKGRNICRHDASGTNCSFACIQSGSVPYPRNVHQMSAY
jgi:hypothetical protein